MSKTRISAAIYGWDWPLLTFIYPGFEHVAHLERGSYETAAAAKHVSSNWSSTCRANDTLAREIYMFLGNSPSRQLDGIWFQLIRQAGNKPARANQIHGKPVCDEASLGLLSGIQSSFEGDLKYEATDLKVCTLEAGILGPAFCGWKHGVRCICVAKYQNERDDRCIRPRHPWRSRSTRVSFFR